MTIDRRAFLGRMLLMPFGIKAQTEPTPQKKRVVHLKNVYIAGTQYHDMSENKDLARLRADDPLYLRREPQNPYDEYAIAVYTRSNQMIGYIPRHQNRTVARIMDQGVTVTATVEKVAPDTSPWRRIWIRVQEEV